MSRRSIDALTNHVVSSWSGFDPRSAAAVAGSAQTSLTRRSITGRRDQLPEDSPNPRPPPDVRPHAGNSAPPDPTTGLAIATITCSRLAKIPRKCTEDFSAMIDTMPARSDVRRSLIQRLHLRDATITATSIQQPFHPIARISCPMGPVSVNTPSVQLLHTSQQTNGIPSDFPPTTGRPSATPGRDTGGNAFSIVDQTDNGTFARCRTSSTATLSYHMPAPPDCPACPLAPRRPPPQTFGLQYSSAAGNVSCTKRLS